MRQEAVKHTEKASPVVALLLASGLSSRMGRVKFLLPWKDGTILSHTIQNIREGLGMPLFLVHHGDVPLYPEVVLVDNAFPERGMAFSLQCGLDAVRRQCAHSSVAIFLSDQPFVCATDIVKVVDAFRRRPPDCHAVRPWYNATPGHPVILDEEGISWAFQLQGDQGMRGLLARDGSVGHVGVDVIGRPNPAIDIDTPEEYRQALAMAKEFGGG